MNRGAGNGAEAEGEKGGNKGNVELSFLGVRCFVRQRFWCGGKVSKMGCMIKLYSTR
jgi:hypothetical protein